MPYSGHCLNRSVFINTIRKEVLVKLYSSLHRRLGGLLGHIFGNRGPKMLA